MLDQIISEVKSQIGGDLISKFGLNSQQKDKAFSITEETLKDTVKKEANGNGLSGLMNLFSSNDNNAEGNSMLEKIGGSLISNFSSGLGVSEEKSMGIKDMILNKVMELLNDKLGSNFDVSSLLGLVGGGNKSEGLLGKLGGLFGKR